ncbi:hypothetical protein H6A05_01835 [Megasphaera elsdenii]|uniref:phage baseplate protein n=1 Tax=Megasphaera elsdenii TaxID=907 RepID=UPI00195BC784|nr:hypothetical protein [Megasphaera elsdenii]MBM6701069.1 hypothetical protein [Megasphaera elsdenii]
MAKYNDIVVTNNGLDMVAESETAKPLIFTKIQLGDGQLTEVDDIKQFTALKHPCMNGVIHDIETGTTWVKMDAGRVLVSAGSYTENGTTYTYNLGDKGGEAKHPLTIEELTKHGHIASCSTDGLHTHTFTALTPGDNQHEGGSWNGSFKTAKTREDGEHSHTITVGEAGNNQPHENRMPYEAVHRWKRTA